MQVRVLGAAAGGGLPQWNCRCANCAAARAGASWIRPRTQSSVAISGDGRAWFLLNVSPDIRQQVLAFAPLGPPEGHARGSGIAGCVLTDAELDHAAGLLLLREGSGYSICSTPLVRRWLESRLSLSAIGSGLRLSAFEVDRHVPRFIDEDAGAALGSVVGLRIEDTRTRGVLVYVPCLARVVPALEAAVAGANCVLVDGTFWSDDEPIRAGIGPRGATEMGHLPVSGPGGSLAWLAGLSLRRAYVHINNTNPMLDERSAEAAQVRAGGVAIAADGDAFEV
jgi:pyrroloquinoline quinone biosynthesis protein B